MPDGSPQEKEDPQVTIQRLQVQVKGLENANKRLQVRALQAELGEMQAQADLINIKAPIAQAQLKTLEQLLATEKAT